MLDTDICYRVVNVHLSITHQYCI